MKNIINKISDSKNIWDYAYEADNNKKFNPMPYKIILSLNDENETTLEYGIIGWYDYNNANLGCKWDAELECIQISEDKNTITVCFRFDTPWRSPDNWMFKMIKKYNKLYFALEGIEPGVGFIMNVEGENGEITDNSTSDLSDYEEFTNNDLV